MVIDSDIATGDAIIYNRETDTIETITLAEKHTLYENIRRLAEDTVYTFVNGCYLVVVVMVNLSFFNSVKFHNVHARCCKNYF